MAGKASALRRILLWGVVAASLLLTVQGLSDLRATPGVQPLIQRTAAEYRAAVNAALAEAATEGRVAGLLSAYMAQSPRDWVATEAVLDVAAERGLALHPTLIARIETARAEDTGLWATATACGRCAVDMASCGLSQALICNAPVTLSPVGDVIGMGRQGVNWATGAEVDRLDLALSTLGLGATAAVVVSGGGSATVKAGASGLRLARGMGLLNARLTARLVRVAEEAIDTTALRRITRLEDVPTLLRPGALDEIGQLATGLTRLQEATDTRTALRLLPHLDEARDATRMADAAAVFGRGTLGRVEVLGKARLFRLGLRLSDTARDLLVGLAGLGAALLGFAQSLGLRLARALLRGRG